MTNEAQTFNFEATAELTCTTTLDRSTWQDDIEDAQVQSIWILGTEYTREGLIEWLGAYGAEKFMEKILDEAPTDEWETE